MKDWHRDVEESLWGQLLISPDREQSLEASFPEKQTAGSVPLDTLPETSERSPGRIQKTEHGWSLTAPLRRECWPEGLPQDGDYCSWGQADALFLRGESDWSEMNRLAMEVRVCLPGSEYAVVNASILMDQGDAYAREGETTFHVSTHTWTPCFYEFPELDMRKARGVRLYMLLTGQDTVTAPEVRLEFRKIRLEHVLDPEPFHGWMPRGIAAPLAGWLAEGRKQAVAPWRGEGPFFLSTENGPVFEGSAEIVENEKGRFALLDCSEVKTPGEYTLRYAGLETRVPVREDLLEESLWKSTNFLYGERCGFPVPGRHAACHLDSLAHHGGVSLSYAGGWHDAGDVSQQTLQTGEIVLNLLEAAEKVKDPRLAVRLRLEAEWGLDFVLRTRFGDGFRATSAGATRWTDCCIGNADDVAVRVHDHPFENLMLAGIEAGSARILSVLGSGKAGGILRTAEEDFEYGFRAYKERGMQKPSMYEHSFNSGASLYDAAVSWASGQLYRASGKPAYLEIMKASTDAVTACQETDGPMPGPFYRDRTKRMLMHFNHQSREHLYMDAIVQALKLSGTNRNWEEAARRYADYLRRLHGLGMPYGMLPAGLHRMDEAENREIFECSHLLVDYETEKPHYLAQLGAGIRLDDLYTVRMFPVWFSFRGNTAVHLSMGRCAAVLGTWMQDDELKNIAREQIYWVLGKNPFSQSLQYGMGKRYCSQYAVFPGELTGEIPVGIETRGDEDIPFWPQGCNATYKEVWTSSVGRWIGLAAALMGDKEA